MNGNNNAAAIMQQNLRMRDVLKQTSYRFRKDLGNVTGGTLGGTTRIKLYNVGLITRLLLRVSASLTIGTAVAVPSDKAPFNLISSIKLTDFDNVDRINCSGFQLFSVDCVRRRTYFGYNNEAAPQVFSNPTVPTAVATAALNFFIEVPLAYDEQDLRGMLLAQTAVGEAYLAITWNTALITQNDDDAVYTGAATSTVVLEAGGTGINVNTWQDFIYPQNITAVPPLDVATVYELAGNVVSTDNLAAGAEKLISLPNVRTVIGTHFTYLFNNQMSDTDVTKWRIIANGNNIILDETAFCRLFEQRMWLNSDLREGAWFFVWRERPIETVLFGNVQIGFTPANADANSHLEICHESFYLKGLALPGLPQTA